MNLDELDLCGDENDAGCKCQRAEGIWSLIFGKDALAIDAQHQEINEHSLGGSHKHPLQVDFEIESAVALAFCVEFWHG